ncbi:MAG: hypothetical protein R3B48_29810 [Kofleriaceae bacterium]
MLLRGLLSFLAAAALATSSSGCMTYTMLVITDKGDPAKRFEVSHFALATGGEAVAASVGYVGQTTGSRNEKLLSSVGITVVLDLAVAAVIAVIANADY